MYFIVFLNKDEDDDNDEDCRVVSSNKPPCPPPLTRNSATEDRAPPPAYFTDNVIASFRLILLSPQHCYLLVFEFRNDENKSCKLRDENLTMRRGGGGRG